MMDNSEEILTQETHAENEEMMEEGNDEYNQTTGLDTVRFVPTIIQAHLKSMNNLLKDMFETDFMNLQVEGKQSQLKTKRKRIHDRDFLAYLAQNNNACGIMALTMRLSSRRHSVIATRGPVLIRLRWQLTLLAQQATAAYIRVQIYANLFAS